MPDGFQRLLRPEAPAPAVLSLNVQAAMGTVQEPERSQFTLLVRHFLERFFNHETASPDGDGKTRLIQLAFATALPGFVVAIYLWPVYHPVIVYPPHPGAVPGPPPYWAQVNHHFFFVLFSFVAMGLITVFEWDLFFPDLLDNFVLGTLPIPRIRNFLARITAIGLLLAGFLFDANCLAPLVLPAATDPPNLVRFLGGHLAAVGAAGLFSATLVLALESLFLALLGERFFRKVSLVLQGLFVVCLVMLLLLFPVLTGVTPALLRSHNTAVLWFPPYWFLGINQYVLEGASALPVFGQLARAGTSAVLAVLAIAVASYPVAYARRVKYLLEGAPPRAGRMLWFTLLTRIIHASVARSPIQRSIFHFINQTLLRVTRYRIYLVLYGGVGVSVLFAILIRLAVLRDSLRISASAEGIRMAGGVVAFWTVAGLRTSFTSSGNQRGSWIFRFTHGRPAHFNAGIEEFLAGKIWVVVVATAVTVATEFLLWLVSPPELLNGHSILARFLVGVGLCIVLTDAFFANVTTLPFTGEAIGETPNIAFTLLRFFTFFPLVVMLSLSLEVWAESAWINLGIVALIILVVHLWFRHRHREMVRIHSQQCALEEGEEDFPMKLGLRY